MKIHYHETLANAVRREREGWQTERERDARARAHTHTHARTLASKLAITTSLQTRHTIEKLYELDGVKTKDCSNPLLLTERQAYFLAENYFLLLLW